MHHFHGIQATNVSFIVNDYAFNYSTDRWQSTMDANIVTSDAVEDLVSPDTADPEYVLVYCDPPPITGHVLKPVRVRIGGSAPTSYYPFPSTDDTVTALAGTSFDDVCDSFTSNPLANPPPLVDETADLPDLYDVPCVQWPTPPLAFIDSPYTPNHSPGPDTPPFDAGAQMMGPADLGDLSGRYTTSPAPSFAQITSPYDSVAHSSAIQDADSTLPPSNVELPPESQLEWHGPREERRACLKAQAQIDKPRPRLQGNQVPMNNFRLHAREAEITENYLSDNDGKESDGRPPFSSGKAPYIEREEDSQGNPIPNGSRNRTKRKREDEPVIFIMDRVHHHSGPQSDWVDYYPGGSQGTPNGVELESERPFVRNKAPQRGGCSEVTFQIVEYEHEHRNKRRR